MREEKEKDEKDLDFGFGLGGLFKGIEKIIDLAAEVKKHGGEINKEGKVNFGNIKNGATGVYGFSIKTAVGGEPIVESFGNMKNTPKGPTVEEEREPITDVFDEKNEIKIYMEMPGVNKEDIKLDLKEDLLDVSAKNSKRKYHKELLLPSKVKSETLIWDYKNGILEIKIGKY
jgi:HSP20 family protein